MFFHRNRNFWTANVEAKIEESSARVNADNKGHINIIELKDQGIKRTTSPGAYMPRTSLVPASRGKPEENSHNVSN